MFLVLGYFRALAGRGRASLARVFCLGDYALKPTTGPCDDGGAGAEAAVHAVLAHEAQARRTPSDHEDRKGGAP